MNRIYRSIWNQATGAYAAVSENVKSAGKRSLPGCSGGGAHFALTSMAAALMLGYGSLALAGPAGGTVVAGQASIHGAPGATVIQQSSQNAVINWASFNIGKGESVQFQQPNSNAVALNRVLGGDGTTILGNLSANGKVFIVNPNGVLFGKGASVNTAGLVASTLDISNNDFMSGKYQFSGSGTGKVLNQGSISAPGGYVALLGANVSNEGTIQARLGSVALAAGKAITLDVAGDGLLNVAVDRGAVGALVNNGGLIQADGGTVVLSAQAAGDLLKTVVNNTGVIEAHTIATRGGTIKLLGDMQSGTVNAAGTLDASAPAGAVGSRGGFIDTSAAHVKIADGLKVTTAAPQGLSGTWLIDPSDFNIAVSGGDMTGAFLSNSLKSGNVQIQSVSGGSGTQGNINVNDNVNWSANKLTLTAHNNININRAMRGAGTASLALEYGQGAVVAGNLSTYNVKAEVDLPSGNNFSTKLGSNDGVVVYQVINSLGAVNSSSGSDVQGMQGNLSGRYVLGSNIDARATGSWESGRGFMPIGNDTTPFTGTLDGLGHEIIGLTINRSQMSIGMFGNIGLTGIVHNLSLSNVNIAGSQAAYGYLTMGIGALAGRNNGMIDNVSSSGVLGGFSNSNLGGLVGINAGVISDSRAAGNAVNNGLYGNGGGLVGTNATTGLIKSSSSAVAVTSGRYAGGLVGNNMGNISNSHASGIIAAGYNNGTGGGLVGISYGSVSNSYATGNVSGMMAGGLVGSQLSGTVDNSYATGNVFNSGFTSGGLVGSSYGSISNSYASGNVTGSGSRGGLVGGFGGGTISNVYYSNKLSAGGTVGLIVGNLSGGNLANAYYDKTLNPALGAIGNKFAGVTSNVQGLTSAQMLQGSNFAGFTFTTTAGATGNNWVIVSGDGSLNGTVPGTRPMLASEWSNTINSTHQLQLMAMNKTASYTLGSNFSAAGTASTASDVWGSTGFIPVGTSAEAFTGKFDGTGHIVSNLNIYKSGVADVGLFGVVGSGGVIANVGLSGGTIVGGGNVGALVGTNGGSVSGSFATSTVTGANNVGGLVGINTGTGNIKDSYASGAVTGSSGVGGLLGSNSGTVATSYANGSVSGVGGGLVGAGAGSVTGSYWDTTASGKASGASAGGTGMTTSELKMLSNYTGAGWDLGQMWVAYDGRSAPFLRSFMKEIVVRVSYNTQVYDGVAYAGSSNSVAYSNVYNDTVLLGTPVYTGNTTGAVNAGTYVVTASGLYSTNGQSGYAVSYIDGGLVITPRSVTLSGAVVAGKVYDGTTVATISGTVSGVLAGDLANVSSTVSGRFASKNAGNGIAVTTNATLGGSAGGNYVLVPVNGLRGNISKATISGVSGIVAGNKVYDGSVAASLNTAGASFAGMMDGDTLTVSGASGSFADKNAASGKTVSISGIALGGTDASNYNLSNTSASSTANISKASISGVGGIVAGNKVYDGSLAASLSTAGASFAGMVGGDTLTVSGASGNFRDKSAGTGKTVDVSGITLGGTDAGNYTLANDTASSNANISKASISSVTDVGVNSKTYDGSSTATLNGAGTINGMVNGDSLTFSAATAVFNDKNAGSKTVSVDGIVLGGADAGNYTLGNATASGSGTITAKTLTLSSIADKVYDGSSKASFSQGVLNGLVGSEVLDISGSGSYADKNAGVGKAFTVNAATLADAGSGASAGMASNYVLATPSGVTGTVSKASINGVTGIVANNKVYDGNALASLNTGSASFAGMVGGDNLAVTGASGSFADKNAASGKTVSVTGIALGGADAGNYTLASNTASTTADIAKASISAVGGIMANSKVYDGNALASLNTGSASFAGMVGGDNLVVTGASGSFADKNAANGKTVSVTGIALGGTDAGNYVLASNTASTTADITKASISAVGGITANSKVYDGNATASLNTGSASFAGMVGGDNLVVTGASGSFADKNAASGKMVSVTGIALGGTDAGNYTLLDSTASTMADIAKASISAVAGITAGNKVYDGNTGASLNTGSAAFTGMVGGDNLVVTGASGSFADKNAASGKTVSVTGIALGGTDAGNYTLASTTASTTADIAKASISAVAGITAGNKVYDGNALASLNTGSAVFTGMVGGDSLTVATATGSFTDKNAANGKTVNVSGIALGGTDAGNYTLINSTASTTADIAKASISAVAGITAGNKVYDGNALASLNTSSASFAGMVGGDNLTVTGASGSFADKNAASGKTVSVTGIALGGTDAGNYTLINSTASTTADIAKASISAIGGITANSKVYDGNATASLNTGGAAFTGMVGGDNLVVTSASGGFVDKNAASGKTVSVTGIALGGADAGNYTLLNSTASTTADIAKASIANVAGITAGNKVYDGNATASLNTGSTSFAGMVGGDNLTVSNATGSFGDKNAASGKTVSVTGIVLGGTDAGNYTLASNTASTTADIAKASISAVAGITAGNKVYDGNTGASLNTGSAAFTGMVGGDNLVVTGASGSFTDKNAASGKTVSVTGIVLGGTDAGNYVLASNTASTTADIAKASISAVGGITANNKVYDGNALASLNTGGASFTSMIGGDSLTVATATGSFADKNAANGKTVSVTGIALGGTDAGNYTLASNTASTTADIAKASIANVAGITANNKVYDGNALASLNTGGASFTGMVGGDNLTVATATGSFADKNAASGKTVSVTGIALGGTDAGNYVLASNTASTTADIAKASISGVAGITAGNKVYDGNTGASLNTGSAAFTGMVGGDSLTVATATGSFADKNAASGKTVSVTGIALGGTDAGNYTLINSTASTTADIAKASIAHVAGIVANNKVYDGNALASLNTGSAAFAGMVGGDNLTVSNATGSFGDKNAASGKTVSVSGIALGGADAGNYTLASNTASTTADIAKASVSAVAGITAGNKVYDGNALASLNTGSASFTGMVGGDNLAVATATGSFADKNAANGKTVSVTGIALGGTDAGNYTLINSTASTTADIAKASIANVAGITANNKVYDGNALASLNTGSAAFTGMVGGDNLTVSNATGSFGDKNAASGKTVSVSGIALGGTDAGNYVLASNTVSTTADISKASITNVAGITAGNKVYDGNTGASLNTGSASFAGMVGGDNLVVTGASGSFADKNAASGKTVSVTGIALGGTDAGNYTLLNSTASTTADIAKASISAVGGITANSKVYDGNALASLNTGSAAFTGMVGGDSLTVATATGSFADKNAASGKTVSVTGIALGGTDAGNYTLLNSTASTTADIAKASISAVGGITANNKVYDGNALASLNTGSAAFTGMVGGDNLTVSNATGSFGDKNAASGKTVSVTGIALGGTDAGNYTLLNSTASTTADIAKASISAVGGITANSKVYDGNTGASLNTGSAAFTGMVGGDSLTVATATGSFADKNAASGKTVNVSGIALGGTDAGNYTLASTTASTTADIAKASISAVGGITANSKVYDGNALASLNTGGASFTGMVGGDNLTVSNATGSFGDKNAASGKTVNVSGIALGGTDAGNYTLVNSTASTTADIAKASISAVGGITANNKVYDGNALASLNTGSAAFTGMVGGDNLAVATATGSFADKNAASGKTVSVTGIALGGADAGNYVLASNTASTTADIAKASISAVGGITANSKVYDGNALASLNMGGAAFTGMVGGDNLVVTSASGSFGDKNAASGKTVSVTGIALGGTDAGNYTLLNSTASTTADIAKASISAIGGITANSKVYDGNALASLNTGSAVFTGMVGGDSLAVATATGSFGDKNAASGKTVSVTGIALGGADAGNYNLATNTSSTTASITPKALTVAGQLAGNKIYDGNAVASLSGGVLSGLVDGESLAIAGQTASFSDKNVANGKLVTVTGTTLLDTASGLASNYTVGNPTGLTASITPASLLVSVSAAAKVYDGLTDATVTFADNRIAGDVLAINRGSAHFSDKNVANGKTVTVGGIGISGTDAANYIVNTTAVTTASITPATLLVSATDGSKVYDATNGATVNLHDNRVAGDQFSIVTNGATFADKNVGQGKTVTVDGIRLAGADAGNYVFNRTAASSADITPAKLTIKANNAEKNQGSPNPEFGATYSGLLGSDTLASELTGSLLFNTAATTGSVAANYLITPSGQASGNYAITYVDGILKVNPMAALQSAVTATLGSLAIAPSLGNMVQADQLMGGDTPAAPASVARDEGAGKSGAAPALVQISGSTVTNVLPGLRLSVINQGLLLPPELGVNTDLAK